MASECPAGLISDCDSCPYSKESLCDYPYIGGKKILIATMIDWKFECLECGYRFTALQPKELYNGYTKCAMCGSKTIEKKVAKRGEGNGKKGNKN